MITIANLTERQRALAELLWTCQSQQDVDALVAALPAHCVADARSLITVILWESAEAEGELALWAAAAQQAIDRVR